MWLSISYIARGAFTDVEVSSVLRGLAFKGTLKWREPRAQYKKLARVQSIWSWESMRNRQFLR